jgi:hypothetical protein
MSAPTAGNIGLNQKNPKLALQLKAAKTNEAMQ